MRFFALVNISYFILQLQINYYGQSSEVSGAQKIQLVIQSLQVTPNTMAGRQFLNLVCACGGVNWAVGVTTTLTTCTESCNPNFIRQEISTDL